MMTELKNKPNYFLIRENGEKFGIYVVSDFTRSHNVSIINNESATGNGGVSYSNGRTQETMPVNGTLIAEDRAAVETIMNELNLISDTGEVVEFVGPYASVHRSNKFFLQHIDFTPTGGNEEGVAFSMNLSESREANVETVSVNLVNFAAAELFIDLFNARTGQSS